MGKITPELIISTASQLISQTKKAEISLTQIADQLDVTHAAIYKHFKNKQALWEAVAAQWFQENIIAEVKIKNINAEDPKDELHEWLWQFVNAKKKVYHSDPQMFLLNTQYIDNNPAALNEVLIPAYQIIDQIMGYADPGYERAETLLAAFSTFTLPNFKDTWDQPDYQKRFEMLWQLVKDGL